MRVKHLRDTEGNFYDSYLGDDGRYYRPEDVFDEEDNVRDSFEIYDMTDDEVAENVVKDQQITAENNLSDLRKERDKRLTKTDWVVTRATEEGTAVSDEWKQYRQALRDITNTYTSLDDVVWPEKP